MFQQLPVRVLLQPICTGELSKPFIFLQSLAQKKKKKYKGKDKENQKNPIIAIFTICLNVTFTDNRQKLRTQQRSSKAMNSMSWKNQTEINFQTLKIVCKLLNV